MKTYKYLYSKMLDEDIIRAAWKKLRKGKTKRIEVQQIEADFENEVKNIQEMIRNTKPPGVDVEHTELAFQPKKKEPKIIYEHGKRREIYMPEIKEQWIHHIIVKILEPILLKSAYPHSCGSVPGKGAHYGKRVIEKWLKKDPKNTRNFFKIDVRHFYSRIQIKLVIKKLSAFILDDWFLHVLAVCFTGFDIGIPLGFYLSQWLANFFLKDIDYYAKHKAKVHHFIRYLDDMIGFAASKKKLQEAIIGIMKELGKKRLKLKRTYQACKFEYLTKRGKLIGRPLDFMGFVFHRGRTIIRKRIMIESTRLAAKIAKEEKIFINYARAMLSYMGWFSCTDTYNCYLKYIKPFVSVKKLKKIISKYDRRNNNDKLGKRNMLTAAA